nr:MAG TPA: hypothetical protein [Caudoviricetes sp.]
MRMILMKKVYEKKGSSQSLTTAFLYTKMIM